MFIEYFLLINNVFNKNDYADEYISKIIIESQSEYFERVYKLNMLNNIVYKTKEYVKDYLTKEFNK